MLLLQKLSIVLALMQFGTAVVIPSSQIPSKLSDSNIKSPVHPIPAVRPAVNRQLTVVVRAGMSEHVGKIANLAYKAALFSPAGRCINTMIKNCINSIRPISENNPFSFPIDLRSSEDWEFVGFHGTINQFFDHEQQTIQLPTERRAEMNRLGEGIYVTDSIMDARYRAQSSHHECIQQLNKKMEGMGPDEREGESKSSSHLCDYSMCAAFVSKIHWSKVNKVLLSRYTPHVWEGAAEKILQQHLSKLQLESPVIISHVYRNGQSMEMKFPLEHSDYLVFVCGPDDVAEKVLSDNFEAFTSSMEKEKTSDVTERDLGAVIRNEYWSNQRIIERDGSFAVMFNPLYFSNMLALSLEKNVVKGKRGELRSWGTRTIGSDRWLN